MAGQYYYFNVGFREIRPWSIDLYRFQQFIAKAQSRLGVGNIVWKKIKGKLNIVWKNNDLCTIKKLSYDEIFFCLVMNFFYLIMMVY